MDTQETLYLDHASTSYPKPPEVHEAVQLCLQEACVNPGRGAYRMAAKASEWVEETRRAVATFFGLQQPERTLFTLNCTDAINTALKGILQPGARVLSTQLEHNAVARPLHALQHEHNVDVEWLPVDLNGFLSLETVRTALAQKPVDLVIVNHASNVVGSIQPIESIGRLVRESGALFMIDAAQTAGVVPLDMEKQCIDLLAWPAHKGLYGHMGLGGLCVGPRVTSLKAWRQGGTGTDSLSLETSEIWPSYLEAGTVNMLGIASLRGGLQALQKYDLCDTLKHHQTLRQTLCTAFENLGLPYLGQGPIQQYVGTISFNIPELDPHTLSGMLDASFQIATRSGLHCAPLAHQAMQTAPSGTVRVSVGRTTTLRDVELFIDAIANICQHVRV